MSDTPTPSLPHHLLRRMVKRPHDEEGRAATPLELLYDLVFVIAFGVAGEQAAHAIAYGHVAEGAVGFLIAMAAVCWPWILHTFFASVFDNDDMFCRFATFIQMAGVLTVAWGIPELFHGLEDGWKWHVTTMIVGYAIMRSGVIALWIRTGLHLPRYRQAAWSQAGFVTVAQFLWVALAFSHPQGWSVLIFSAPIFILEWGGPCIIARVTRTELEELRVHPHHITERFGLLIIIALGEGIIGTFAAIKALVEGTQWSAGAVSIVACGMLLTFGMWWVYFTLPYARALTWWPQYTRAWSYLHLGIFPAIAGMGAGLHAIAYHLEGKAKVSESVVMGATVAPVAAYWILSYLSYWLVLTDRSRNDRLQKSHVISMALYLLICAAAQGAVMAGAGFVVGLAILTTAPWVMVFWMRVMAGQEYARVQREVTEDYSSADTDRADAEVASGNTGGDATDGTSSSDD